MSLPLLVAVISACESAPPLRPEPLEPGIVSTSWRTMPHSWARLEAIEDWLLGPGPERQPELATEAELLLAEGRLLFAKSDARTLEAAAMSRRLGAAEAGFRRVLGRNDSGPTLRDRARRGLDAVRDLRGGAAPTAIAGILPRTAWSARRPISSNLTINRRPWSRITVHHTAMHSSTLGRASQGETAESIQGIQRQHMDDRAFGDIGYHYLIDPTGRVWAGRSTVYQGAHARGSNNVANLGVCLLGSFDQERPSPRALAALQQLLDSLRRKHHISRQNVFGHQDFTITECPGRHLMSWVEGYKGGLTAARR